MSNPVNVVHVCYKVRTGAETWEGNAWYEEPTGADGWRVLQVRMVEDLWSSLPQIIDVNCGWRLTSEADRYIVHGGMADSYRRRFRSQDAGEVRAVTWEPLMATVFGLGTNGRAK